MKQILVAGAGHGGLSAALNLAKAGYTVTVLEKKQRDEMGYDWHDCISVLTLRDIGVAPLPDNELHPYNPMAYRGPSKDVTLTPAPPKGAMNLKYVERKVLLAHLMNEAEQAGVTFQFGCAVSGVIIEDNAVTGVRYTDSEGEQKQRADLVIDSAGMDSPLRRTLPESFGIQREIDAADTMFVYRAYYNKTEPRKTEPPCNMYFYHCRRKGLDWLITEEDFADILVGTFGPMTEEEIQTAVADIRQDNPFVGEHILRGGCTGKIPLRPALPLLAANGYALVGDAASMVECLSGSGMDLAMRAGKMLADTVIALGEAPCSVANLWAYQATYFKKCGFRVLGDNMLKHFLIDAGASGVDALFRKKILTEREMSGAGRHYTKKELTAKALAVLSAPALWIPLVKLAKQNSTNQKIKKSFPTTYDPVAVEKWKRIYRV